MMNCKPILTAAVLALSSASVVSAATLNFDFSFSNLPPLTVTTVTGTVNGLQFNGLGQTASSVVITDHPFLSGTLFEYAFGAPVDPLHGDYSGLVTVYNNSFDVVDGVIVASSFRSCLSLTNVSTTCLLMGSALTAGGDQAAITLSFPGNLPYDLQGPLLFAAGVVVDQPPIPSVPLPAGGLLLLSGLAGAVALKRRKTCAA